MVALTKPFTICPLAAEFDIILHSCWPSFIFSDSKPAHLVAALCLLMCLSAFVLSLCPKCLAWRLRLVHYLFPAPSPVLSRRDYLRLPKLN